MPTRRDLFAASLGAVLTFSTPAWGSTPALAIEPPDIEPGTIRMFIRKADNGRFYERYFEEQVWTGDKWVPSFSAEGIELEQRLRREDGGRLE